MTPKATIPEASPDLSDAVRSLTSKGQVTIPKAVRQQLGLGRGSRVSFAVVGDHIEVRAWKPPHQPPTSGFGLLHSRQPPLPVDFDPATLLQP
jgi:AbrB family looped-hinge helix DNA binding protein